MRIPTAIIPSRRAIRAASLFAAVSLALSPGLAPARAGESNPSDSPSVERLGIESWEIVSPLLEPGKSRVRLWQRVEDHRVLRRVLCPGESGGPAVGRIPWDGLDASGLPMETEGPGLEVEVEAPVPVEDGADPDSSCRIELGIEAPPADPVSGTLDLKVKLMPPVPLGTVKVRLYVDGMLETELAAPASAPTDVSLSFDTARYRDGGHLIVVNAWDGLGHDGVASAAVSFSNGSTSNVYCPPPHDYDFWRCTAYYEAYTSDRRINGRTRFECGDDICGDDSHTQPTTWVDIVGGISDTCQDHDESFFGPFSGEWDGCASSFAQWRNTGRRRIAAVVQNWRAWPATWYTGDFLNLAGMNGATDSMHGPFATVYDLDYCFSRQLIGTVHWPDFTITSRLTAGNPALGGPFANFSLTGSTGLTCGQEGSCGLPAPSTICSDLQISGRFNCVWVAQSCGSGLK